jgi:phage-related minor tail protein
MSAQDRTEQVLREIHILFSKSEVYDKEKNKIIVDKKEVLELLSRLNTCIYEIMEEHELTQQSRDKAERELRRRGDEIVSDASRKAEDVYAASVIYTDEALHRIQDIMQAAADSVQGVYEKMNAELLREKEIVHRDQSELKRHLEGLTDTEKYLKLIEESNKQIEKEKAKEKEKEKPQGEYSPYSGVKPEIKINAEYFERAGIPIAEDLGEEIPEEKPEPVTPQVNVNLDAEYFKWKEEGGEEKPQEKKSGKHTLFGKIVKE